MSEPTNYEPATVRCIRAGWENDEDGMPQFRAVVIFDSAPNWPFNVAWGDVPICMQPVPTSTGAA